MQLPLFCHYIPYVCPSYLNNWQKYWKSQYAEYVDQTDVLFLSHKMYLEAILHDVDSKIHYADKKNFSIISLSAIFIFPVNMDWVHYVSSELCNKLQNIHWGAYANTNASLSAWY